MEGKGQNLGREFLVYKLRERGLSRRDALRILNFVFREMSKALARDEEVEFPFGKLNVVQRSFGAYWESMRDTPAHLDLYTVEFELDGAGDRLLNGPSE